MIVLDTNVLSELLRPTPDARVPAWLAAQPRSVARGGKGCVRRRVPCAGWSDGESPPMRQALP